VAGEVRLERVRPRVNRSGGCAEWHEDGRTTPDLRYGTIPRKRLVVQETREEGFTVGRRGDGGGGRREGGYNPMGWGVRREGGGHKRGGRVRGEGVGV
jgi:hypothetical protein